MKLLQNNKKVTDLYEKDDDDNLIMDIIKNCKKEIDDNNNNDKAPIWIQTVKLQLFWMKKYRLKGIYINFSTFITGC